MEVDLIYGLMDFEDARGRTASIFPAEPNGWFVFFVSHSTAASNNHEAVVRMLVKSGADVTKTNIYSHTPLDLATSPICR